MKLLIVGDFCPQDSVVSASENRNYEIVLGEVKSIIGQADYAIANFECPVVYGTERPIDKCGPNLKCSEYGIEAVAWAGFHCLTLANNHFRDYGEVGMSNTLTACQKYRLDVVGGGMCLEDARKILYKKINEKIVAIANCCEHEFSIATGEHGGCNPLNPIQQYYAIREARKNADYVVVIVHGGHELYQLPSTRMQDTYRFFIDAGADAVVNHHQHCFSGMEIYKGKPIFYGLGNFLFDTRNKHIAKTWYEGYMVMLELTQDKINYDIIPYRQCDGEVTVRLKKEDELEAFRSKFNALCNVIGDRKQLEECQRRYYAEKSKGRLAAIAWHHKVLRVAYNRGWIPSFLKGKAIATVLNYIMCESHRDILEFALHQKFEHRK